MLNKYTTKMKASCPLSNNNKKNSAMQYRSVTCIMQVTERYVHTSWLLIIHIITWPMTSVIASIRLMAYVTITHSHGSASVVRATKQVNGETQNLTRRHAQTP